jgi:polysaccharide export outer membrane protein
MTKKITALLALFAAFGLGSLVRSQEQNPAPASTSSPSVDSQGVGNYLLGPGDVLDVRVFGQPDLNSLVEIDGDGNISSLPFLESPIKAVCRTDRQVQKEITVAYAKYIRNPQVSVRITERKSRQPATISGAVKTPMQITMMRRVRLHELITRAGGTTDRASGVVQIMHTEAEMCPDPSDVAVRKPSDSDTFGSSITTYKMSDLRLGKTEADPYIRPGDIVQVKEGEPVYVIGMVTAPRELVLRDQLTLQRAILLAGGAQPNAKTSEVHIYRIKDGKTSPENLTYNYDAIKKGKAPDVPLQANDVIEVGKASLFSAKGMSGLMSDLFKSTAGTVALRGVLW